MDKIKIEPKIKSFIKKVNNKIKLNSVYFFGSRTRNDYLKSSDYDFIFVSDQFENIFFSKRTALLYDFWNLPQNLGALCYTTDEFNLKKDQIGIVQEALKNSVKLF